MELYQKYNIQIGHLFWLLIVLMISSCEAQERSPSTNELKVIKMIYPEIDTVGWKQISQNDPTCYRLDNVDTSFVITIILSECKKNVIISDIVLLTLTKVFTVDNYEHTLCLSFSDTLYHYRKAKGNKAKKEFFSGWYYYKYNLSKEQYTVGQKAFFELHKDSLTKLKGNNLPTLPEN